MTQLGEPVPPKVVEIREKLKGILLLREIGEIDAQSVFTGRDFMLKIWHLLASVPLGIAIIDENMSSSTLCNIFYEIGLLQCMGKETIVIKTKKVKVPSDFVRTEYINFDSKFEATIDKYFETFFKLPEFYETTAEQLERNPLLAIDYLRRAYLITGEASLKRRAMGLYEEAAVGAERAKNSVEQLLVDF
jgi:hypothetical protein